MDENGDERAIDFARRAYEAAPSRAEIADTYGWIMLRKGNTVQAVELLNTAIAGAPENSDIRYHFASALANSEPWPHDVTAWAAQQCSRSARMRRETHHTAG